MLSARAQGEGWANVYIWAGLALTFSILVNLDPPEGAPRSPFWWLEYLLFATLFVSLWATNELGAGWKLRVPRKLAPGAFVIVSWLLGMATELTLTRTGEGIGGNHQETIPSFILSQGIYIPLALVALLAVRRWSLTFQQLYFFAGGIALTEGLLFRPAVLDTLLSPLFLLTPLFLAQVVNIYGMYLALPLLLLDPESMYREPPQPRSIPLLMLYGFLAGMLVYIFWGLLYGPAVESLFGFDPLTDEIG